MEHFQKLPWVGLKYKSHNFPIKMKPYEAVFWVMLNPKPTIFSSSLAPSHLQYSLRISGPSSPKDPV